MEDASTLHSPRLAAPLALALLASACAGPMKSTTVLQDRGPDGGTVPRHPQVDLRFGCVAE